MGFNATAEAVKLVIEDSEKLNAVTKRLYPDVAKVCGTSAYSVDRDIRTASRIAFERTPELLTTIAEYPLEKAPKASEFIDILARAVVRRKGSVWH